MSNGQKTKLATKTRRHIRQPQITQINTDFVLVTENFCPKTKNSLPFLDADLHCLFEIKLELAFGGFVEGFFILWPFVLRDWEWYYQIGGFLHRDISI
jgi:hypothetical protein